MKKITKAERLAIEERITDTGTYERIKITAGEVFARICGTSHWDRIGHASDILREEGLLS